MSRKKYLIDRREFLQGTINSAVAVSIGLPLLEMMFESDSLYAHAAEADMRFLHLYIEHGCAETTDTGAQTWRCPQGALPASLPLFLNILGAHRGDLSVVGGLRNPTLGLKELRSGSRPSGANEHHSAVVHALTGAPARNMTSATGARESINNTIGRYLMSQGIVAPNGFHTLQSSLVYTDMYSGANGVHQNFGTYVSWKQDGTHDPIVGEPAALLSQLSLSTSKQCQDTRVVDLKQKSALDFVKGRISKLMGMAGANDRQVLDKYLTSFRETERMVNEGTPSQNCVDTTIPTVGNYGSTHRSSFAKLNEKRAMLAKVVVLGLTSNKVRSMVTYHNTEKGDGNLRNYAQGGYQNVPITSGDIHNEVGHKMQDARNRREFLSYNCWQFQYPLALLNELKAQGMLNKTVFTFGYGLRSADSHGHSGIPFFIAGGRDFGVRLGQSIGLDDVDYKKVLRALLRKFGVPTNMYPEGVRDDINALAAANPGANVSDDQVYARLFSR